MGRFGSSMARELYQAGHDVLAIDLNEQKVQDALGEVTYSVRGDATNETLLKELGIQNFDVAVVAIGTDVQASILTTVLLKSLNIPFIIGPLLKPTPWQHAGADRRRQGGVSGAGRRGRRMAHVEFPLGRTGLHGRGRQLRNHQDPAPRAPDQADPGRRRPERLAGQVWASGAGNPPREGNLSWPLPRKSRSCPAIF